MAGRLRTTFIEETEVPKATTCVLDEREVEIDDAIDLNADAKGAGQLQPDFRCTKCHEHVRPHRAGGKAAAHFEHLSRNPNCPLSDRLRPKRRAGTTRAGER